VYVYPEGVFTMSGGARVTVDNSVYLGVTQNVDTGASSYGAVTIGGDFIDSPGVVAEIELSGYASEWLGKAVLILADDYTGGDLSALKSRFYLPLTGYRIGDDGTLQ
jgi:hypothetical protein